MVSHLIFCCFLCLKCVDSTLISIILELVLTAVELCCVSAQQHRKFILGSDLMKHSSLTITLIPIVTVEPTQQSFIAVSISVYGDHQVF